MILTNNELLKINGGCILIGLSRIANVLKAVIKLFRR